MTESEREKLSKLLIRRIRQELKSPMCLPAWGTLAMKVLEQTAPKLPEVEDLDVFKESTRDLPFNSKGR